MAGGEVIKGSGSHSSDPLEQIERIIAGTPGNPHLREEEIKNLQERERAQARGRGVISMTEAKPTNTNPPETKAAA
ncbi:hypothetical protein FWG76_00050 [Candidatus Saccharibacteria bacterium]|nr:hypothetical protein [Candidatus Saccharibacteria bacterium]